MTTDYDLVILRRAVAGKLATITLAVYEAAGRSHDVEHVAQQAFDVIHRGTVKDLDDVIQMFQTLLDDLHPAPAGN